MLAAVVVASVLASAAPPKVAALEWNVVNLTPELARFYSDALAQALRKEGLDVVTSQDIAALLGLERQKELLGCSDAGESCLAELGSALGCDLVLAANVAKLDEGYDGTLKLLSAVDGAVRSETVITAGSQKGLLEELRRAARRLAEPVLAKAGGDPVAAKPDVAPDAPEVVKPARVPSPLRAKAWMPAVAGGVLLAGAVAGFSVAGAEYARMPTLTEAEAEKVASDGKRLQGVSWIATGLGVAAVATAAVFFISTEDAPPVTPSVSVTPSGAMLGLSGRWP